MKFISLDIETTSLVPSEGVVLQLGAILEDTLNPLSFEESKSLKQL